MPSNYPLFPSLDSDKIRNDLVPEILQWGLVNGLVMYPSNHKLDSTSIAPTTVYPTPFPKKSFDQAVSVQKAYNRLYATISQDGHDHWLSREISKLAKFDPDFTGKLWDLYQRAVTEGISQPLALGVFRSDYLLDNQDLEVKQVEFNTVSVSFGGLSTKVGELHKFLNDSGKYTTTGDVFYNQVIPVSESAELLAKGLSEAVLKFPAAKDHTVVAFIVQDGERNVFDQRIIEYNLFKLYGIKSVRITIHDVHLKTVVDSKTKRLYYLETGEEISLVYFRAGYSPSDFKNEQDWENRLALETSFAIKAPNILTQLAGAKKIQQILTDEAVLKEFINDEDTLDKLKSSFVKIYPLDDTELGKEAKKIAMTSPEKFVLKPQREGGGNNIYKEAIPGFLKSIPEEDWSGYILMELIKPEPTTQNMVLRGNCISNEPILSELGVFGYVLFDNSTIYTNEYAGWLLRSKSSSSDEGGVAAGFGCVDSVLLY
ncbi:LAFE_0D10924g1_1 [Lachancea fermentati]|uniref:Glutathione synthetase n=1 Tax=Lachancea fermentati TaxID=4955 RepID=A0A1G4MC27_LACFM|nr:LAFE_0D10924g1_1 [Lachancea fermentati]